MSVQAASQTTVSARDEEALPDLLRIIRGRRWVVAVAFILTTGVAVVLSLVTPPVYEASSTLIADRTPPVVLLANSSQDLLFQQQVAQAPDVATFTEIVKSQAVRDTAAARLSSLGGPAKARAMLAHVSVQQVRNTEVVRISVTASDPYAAATAANAVAQSVIALDLSARRRLVTTARKFIGGQLEIARQNLQSSENLLADFKNRNRDVSLTDQTLLSLRQLADLEGRLAEVRLQEQEAQAGYVSVVNSDAQMQGPQTQGPQMPLPRSGPDPLVTGLQGQLNTLEVELEGLRKQFTPMHPQVISVQAKVEETKRRLSAAVARSSAALAARKQGLSADIGQVEQTLMQIPTREAALVRLTRNAKEAERTYLLLSQQLEGAHIAEGSIGSSVRIVDVARPPGKPALPRRGLNIILGAVVGLMLGVTGAFVAEQLDNTVRSAEEAGRLLGAPVLGVIPRLPTVNERARGTQPLLLTQLDQASGPAEEFRGLRTHILGAMRTAGHKCLLITSALPREGKSIIVANLAVAMAQTGRSVLLVDCDLRHPTLSAVFPEARSPGLSALLSGHAAIDDIVRPTAQTHLRCVVSGAAVANSAELLDTQPLARFVEKARESTDVILLDTPAVLPVADAEALGPYVDGAVIVARTGRTDRRALAQARDRLEQAGVRLIGVVLNDNRGRSPWFG